MTCLFLSHVDPPFFLCLFVSSGRSPIRDQFQNQRSTISSFNHGRSFCCWHCSLFHVNCSTDTPPSPPPASIPVPCQQHAASHHHHQHGVPESWLIYHVHIIHWGLGESAAFQLDSTCHASTTGLESKHIINPCIQPFHETPSLVHCDYDDDDAKEIINLQFSQETPKAHGDWCCSSLRQSWWWCGC